MSIYLHHYHLRVTFKICEGMVSKIDDGVETR